VVAQEGTAERSGPEWFILLDPRVGGLDESKHKRLQYELEERLSRLFPEVIDRINWDDYGDSDVIPYPTLERWRRELASILADVRPPKEPTETQTNTIGSGAKLLNWVLDCTVKAANAASYLIVVMLTILSIAIAFWTLFDPWEPPKKLEKALLNKAAATLVVKPPTESKVTEQLARLFSNGPGTNAAPGQSLKELLEQVRRSVTGDDRMGDDVLQDERFWESLKKACPQPPAPPYLLAFLSPEDAATVGEIPDPKYVRSLAKVVRRLRDLDTVEAKPDDANLVPLFKSIRDESESITRHSVDESLKIFTRADGALAHSLLRIFQNEDVKRLILEVRAPQGAHESLGTWMRTLGSRGRKGADGLFSDAYFKSQLNVAEEKGSKPKQRCIELLLEFCATCVELVQKSPARQPAPTGVGQPAQ